MNLDELRNNYLKFITYLSENLSEMFGNVWWYSLVHEKNIYKSRTFHDLGKGLKPNNRWVVIGSLFFAVKKFCVLLVRYCIFSFGRKMPKVRTKNLTVSYFGFHLGDLSDVTKVLLPQKNDWKKVFKMVQHNEIYALDSFMKLSDFVYILGMYFVTVFRFFLLIISGRLRELFYYGDWIVCEHNYNFFKKDMWRSFVGDILLEGLYFDRCFKNLSKSFYIKKVIYVYEGLAWEKALCIAFKDVTKVGVFYTAPVVNFTHYHYYPREVKIMPKPNHLGVQGKIPLQLMQKTYGERVFVLGSTRYAYLKRWLGNANSPKFMKQYVLVVLGCDGEQSKELIDYVRWKSLGAFDKWIVVKRHPDSDNFSYGPFPFVSGSLEYWLKRSKKVIAFDSTVVLEAKAFGVSVERAELKSFVDLSPLYGLGEFELDDYFTFNSESRMVEILEGL